MTRHLHLDCIGGIAGDMFIAALLDLGVDYNDWRKIMDLLPLDGWHAEPEAKREGGFAAKRLRVQCYHPPANLSHPPEIAALIKKAGLPERVERDALAILDLLADAEAAVHGIEAEKVHFHELAGVDTIIDLVGASATIMLLNPDTVSCSPLPMGHGTIKIAHGEIPLPAPATLELLKGIPVRNVDIEGETVTPTGAALARYFATDFSPFANGTIAAVGLGAGTRANTHVPNLLRAVLFEKGEGEQWLTVLETNIDDMNPEFYAHVFEKLFEAGARDVWLTPIMMKKGRPAHMLSVLTDDNAKKALQETLYRETTTIGVRSYFVMRDSLAREEDIRETAFGPIRGKRIDGPGGTRWTPEYEELLRIARETGLPLPTISEQVTKSAKDQS